MQHRGLCCRGLQRNLRSPLALMEKERGLIMVVEVLVTGDASVGKMNSVEIKPVALREEEPREWMLCWVCTSAENGWK